MITIEKPKRREFLQLAKPYDTKKPPRGGYHLGGWYISEKLDGGRAFWDGGITRGMQTIDVPWANVMDPKKPGQKKNKIKPIATGLWSRYGNPIMAPDWFLNGLPCIPLDGELFAGRGQFQTTMSIIRKDNPIDSEWEAIQFAVYSSPPLESIFGDGEIKNANFHCSLNWSSINTWIISRLQNLSFASDFLRLGSAATFEDELLMLHDALGTPTDFAYLHKQTRLPIDDVQAAGMVEEYLESVLDVGGEGVIFRAPDQLWYPKRMSHILKYKPYDDDEATITGFTSGRIGKEELLRGKIGALITNYNGKRLEIAGLTHEEREFDTQIESIYAWENPGVDMPSNFQGKHFKIGGTVTFLYRELSDAGIPKDARYFRGT